MRLFQITSNKVNNNNARLTSAKIKPASAREMSQEKKTKSNIWHLSPTPWDLNKSYITLKTELLNILKFEEKEEENEEEDKENEKKKRRT